MKLKCHNLDKKNKEEVNNVKKLYDSAFPIEETLPFWFVKQRMKKEWINFNVFYSNEDFVGFAFTVKSDNLLFVFYLAVESNQRRKGYGTYILNYLKENNKDCVLVLEIESTKVVCDNLEQRLSRVEFYKRNGFYFSDIDVKEPSGLYQTMITGEGLSFANYKKLFNKLFGKIGIIFGGIHILPPNE